MLESLVAQAAVPWQTVGDFLDRGGWVLEWLLAMTAALWALVIERYWYLWRIYPLRKELLRREWFDRAERHSWYARRVRQQSISQLQVGLTAPLPILQAAVPLAPLLGLLGTVTGMLEVFDALSEHAGNDERAMAYGISHAMISTLAGLVVSLVALFFYMQVRTRVRREIELLRDDFHME
jgi:biopolymer transport protein ExbB